MSFGLPFVMTATPGRASSRSPSRQTRAAAHSSSIVAFAAPEGVAEGLEGLVQPDLAAMLEAIGHRLGRRVDLQGDPFDPVFLDHRGQRRAAGPDDPELRILEPRGPRLAREGRARPRGVTGWSAGGTAWRRQEAGDPCGDEARWPRRGYDARSPRRPARRRGPLRGTRVDLPESVESVQVVGVGCSAGPGRGDGGYLARERAPGLLPSW